jgi:hypothetical protein
MNITFEQWETELAKDPAFQASLEEHGAQYKMMWRTCAMSEKPTWAETTAELAEQHAGLLTRLADHDRHTHDIREWCGQQWVYMDGRPYRRATRQEALMAQVTAEPVEDAVSVVQVVARLEERG